MRMITTLESTPSTPPKNKYGLGYRFWGFCATLEKKIYSWWWEGLI